MPAELVSTHTPDLFAAAVERAARCLRAGQLVALPTETVYGLAANAFDAAAVRQIFQVKGRPAHNPLIVHVANLEMVFECVHAWPAAAQKLAASFWPGPLTMVLPKSERIPAAVTAGGSTVGVRWPSHPFMQAVLRCCGFPLAAPSANRSTGISPTTAEHVRKSLGDLIPLIVDGGACQVGIESTVIDLTEDPPAVLRPGMIHSESLLAALGTEEGLRTSESLGDLSRENLLRSPGLLKKHYAPRARLIVLTWNDEETLRRLMNEKGISIQHTHVIAHSRIPGATGFAGVSLIPHDAEAYGRALYAELHRADETGVETIVVEAVPDSAPWEPIRDRLRRASAE
ncbi:MAG: L-threonylcarbamoyladenylate synthase [Verrucomicrobiota bacterium]